MWREGGKPGNFLGAFVPRKEQVTIWTPFVEESPLSEDGYHGYYQVGCTANVTMILADLEKAQGDKVTIGHK